MEKSNATPSHVNYQRVRASREASLGRKAFIKINLSAAMNSISKPEIIQLAAGAVN